MDALKVYPLAHPKGRVSLCELCGTPATLQCAHCKVTYYWYDITIIQLIDSSTLCTIIQYLG